MKVIVPLAITDAMLLSSNAAEPPPSPPWSIYLGATYAKGDIRYAFSPAAGHQAYYESLVGSNTGHAPASSPTWWRYVAPYQLIQYDVATNYGTTTVLSPAAAGSNHRVSKSLQAGNLGNALPSYPEETKTAWWIDIGPTNRWAMFDLERNTQTVLASPLTVYLAPGVAVDSIALGGLEATSVTVEVQAVGSPTVIISTETVTLNGSTSMALFGLYSAAAAVFKVTITNDGTVGTGNVRCGALAIGTALDIGTSQAGAKLDTVNFSVIERDPFGNAVLVPRRSVPRVGHRVLFDKAIIDDVRSLRDELNAVPAVWVGTDDSTHAFFDSLITFGIYREFTISASDPMCELNLVVEEI